eukprot:1161774-Pelagomonas_calceolata.AAC.5
MNGMRWVPNGYEKVKALNFWCIRCSGCNMGDTIRNYSLAAKEVHDEGCAKKKEKNSGWEGACAKDAQ